MPTSRSAMLRMIVVAVATVLAVQGGRGCVKRSASKAITKAVGKTARSVSDDIARELTERGSKEGDRFALRLSVLHKGVAPKSIALLDEWGRPIGAPNAVERRAQEEAARFWEEALRDLPADQALTQGDVLAALANKLDTRAPAGFQAGSGGQTLRITLQTRQPSTVLVDLETTARVIADELSKEASRAYLDSLRVR